MNRRRVMMQVGRETALYTSAADCWVKMAVRFCTLQTYIDGVVVFKQICHTISFKCQVRFGIPDLLSLSIFRIEARRVFCVFQRLLF